ncbi:MAG TPA: DUF3160 domain-containing protein [Mobilitalea sp.]|nr:DUF3160 domain-containing protein [Mobilitalea sp.]
MKRIVAIILCLCLILTGCQSKKGNDGANQNTKDNTAQITKGPDITESAEAYIKGDVVTQLLTLNKAWSVIQTVDLEQPTYEEPAYEAKVEPYSVAKDLSNIENINQFAGFTEEQKQMLVNNGFVVLPSMNTRVNYVYDDNEYKGIPNFVTSDSVLHLYHQFYDKSLMGIETNYLYQDLDTMTKQMLDKSALLMKRLTDTDLLDLQRKNIAYFLVARMLMLQSTDAVFQTDAAASIDADMIDLAKQEYELIQAADGIHMSPLFQVELDYSQFTVRGHYTRSEELSRYFKAMMWFGYSPLAFVKNDEILYDNVLQALLITYTTVADSDSTTTSDAQLWSDIYQPTAQYVGLSDDVNVFTMNGLRNSVYGDSEDPNIYNDPEYRDKLTEAVKKLPEPQIQGKVINSTIPTGKQFRFMGQRYVLDSDILQTLMDPIKRPIPTALDVMGVFGSTTAEGLLKNVYKPQDNWPDYTQKYQQLKDEVSVFNSVYWNTNLYSGWLSSLREVLTEYDKNSGMPFFMTTDAWKYKSLNTALGSYTELKHDTVLYGKQAMAEMGGPLATAAQQYVEPDVKLYYKLLYLTDFTSSVLEDKGMLNENLKKGADTYKEFLNLLIECSIKELKNEPLNDDEVKKLLWCGGTMEEVMMDVLTGVTGDPYTKDPTDMLVTDIATSNNIYVSLATGYFDDIYVVVPYDGKLYLSRGAVYSFYEFNSDKRLTDEEWWALQGIKVVKEDFGEYTQFGDPSADLPKQPDWIHSFKSDTNNVIITSLETIWGNLQE